MAKTYSPKTSDSPTYKKLTKEQVLAAKRIRRNNAPTTRRRKTHGAKNIVIKRNRKWNDSEASEWRKDIENLREKQKQDPNTFDRFAMK